MSDASSPDASSSKANSAVPPVDFSSFVVSLGSSAMVNLGHIADPTTGSATVDLVMARYSIDVLGMLKDKTAGNLAPDEQKLLDTLLFELRTKYTEASKKG